MAAGYIPEDLAAYILSRLPIKSLLRFRCVNKTWNSLLKSSHFINMNLKNPNNRDRRFMFVKYRDRDSGNTGIRLLTCDTFAVRLDFLLPFKSLWCFSVVGSCNGLVCLYDVSGGRSKIILCNPCLNEHKIISESTLYLPERANLIKYVSGFCYDSINKEYKVIWLGVVKDKEGKGYSCLFQVYTLGTNSWRKVGLLDIYIYYWDRAFVNGAMHWLGDIDETKCLVGFDVSSEVFQLLPLPDCFVAGDRCQARIDVNRDLLCLVKNERYIRYEIWVMEEYGVGGSWTRLYAIRLRQPCINPDVLGFGINGELLFDICGRLTFYYPDNEFKEIVDLDDRVRCLCALNYTESLVSLQQLMTHTV